MAIIFDTKSIENNQLPTFVIKIIINAFTILSAFSLRDSVVQGIKAITPGDAYKKFIFTIATTSLFFFITVLLAYFFQDYIV